MHEFTPQEVLETLRNVSLMSLAVSDINNQPQSHMLLFTVDDDFTIYFATVKNSSKYKALLENSKVGVSVWSNKKMLIQILAKAQEIQGDAAATTIDNLADVATRLPDFWPPILQIAKKDEYAVFKLVPHSIRALNLTSSTMTNVGTMFTNIGAQL